VNGGRDKYLPLAMALAVLAFGLVVAVAIYAVSENITTSHRINRVEKVPTPCLAKHFPTGRCLRDVTRLARACGIAPRCRELLLELLEGGDRHNPPHHAGQLPAPGETGANHTPRRKPHRPGPREHRPRPRKPPPAPPPDPVDRLLAPLCELVPLERPICVR